MTLDLFKFFRSKLTSFKQNIIAYSDFSDAIKNGKAKGIAKVTNKLFEKANDGDNTSMIFYLKNRDPDNWEDVQKRRITGEDGGPLESKHNITVEYVSANPDK